MVDERSGTLPPAFYIVLKNNSLGTSVRLSPTYNQRQQDGKYEFQYQMLPLINRYLNLEAFKELKPEPIIISRFKQNVSGIYQYYSFQKIVFSLACLCLSVFLFAVSGIIIFNPFSVGLVFSIIIALLGALLFLAMFLSDFSSTYINTKERIFGKKSLLGFTLAKMTFEEIADIELNNTSLNGITIYTSLFAASKNNKITIDKSIRFKKIICNRW